MSRMSEYDLWLREKGREDSPAVRQEYRAEIFAGDQSGVASKYGLGEHTTPVSEFLARIERDGWELSDAEVCHVATIGADWYIYHSADFRQYVIAQQGHGGGSILGPQRKRPLTWWVTPAGNKQLEAWRAAIGFVTAVVDDDLEAEWGNE
jgi:hypothetical protein